ncbi:MAG: hypothetical protein II566_02860 [Lachnospiraceae bacterium]|nr:hypothetical protein [Lachnospiraceae bacterium]MBQ2576187.1 hypothetical protein [Lachnospiraceae bacterium]
MYPFLIVILTLCILLAVRLAKIRKHQAEKDNAFWDREKQADTAIDKDLNSLTYITIPLSKFPLHFSEDDEVMMIEDALEEIATHRMLNLNGKTNTDLKLMYGPGNLEAVQQMGDDFSQMTILLCDYAKCLMQAERYHDALTVLSFGSSVNSDISTNYMLMGDCYQALHQERKIPAVIEQVKSLHLLLEPKILEYLVPMVPDAEQELENFDK